MKTVLFVILVCCTIKETSSNTDTFGFLNDFIVAGIDSVRNTTMILKQRVQENMAKLEVSDKESWRHALGRIKVFCEGEIRAIYSDLFGLDLTQMNITKSNQKQITLILVGGMLLFSSVLMKFFSLWTMFTLSLLLVSIKSVYGTPAMVQAALYMLGVLLMAVNYALMYPLQCLVLLMTWQLAKYIVWICTPAPATTSDVSGLEHRLVSVEQRLERAEHQLRGVLRQSHTD